MSKKHAPNIKTNAANAHIQFFSINQTSRPRGIASTNAVNADSCRGEIFLVENIVYKTTL